MRFHVVSLPHTQTTKDFTSCAFTEKVRKFCIMMKSLGHHVYLYAGEINEAPCDEHVVCISEVERAKAVGNSHYTAASFDSNLSHWQLFNNNVISSMRSRVEERDFICLIGGHAHKPIADAFPAHISVEFGIGYSGSFAKYRVFESYAWMHSMYGAQATHAGAADGNFFDAVIPSYIEVDDFPFRDQPDDYFLFMGRLIDRKGYQIAVEVCRHLGARLLIAGNGTPPSYGEYVGSVGPKRRAELFGGAIASFAPTIYIEPFGTVVIESQATGTPAITTDWGAFTETVTNGINGFRCRTLKEFITAAENASSLDRSKIRELAVSRYGLEPVSRMYDKYFHQLLTLWEDGWYTL